MDPKNLRRSQIDQVDFFDEPNVELKKACQKVVCGHPDMNAESASLIMNMLGIHPEQLKELEDVE